VVPNDVALARFAEVVEERQARVQTVAEAGPEP
jgi:hypothetical protein